MEIWDILDEKGNITGDTIIRGEKLQDEQYHLVVHIWIINDSGEYLIQKRAENLKHLPDIWATTGGSAVTGEDSMTAALRETKEELGVTVLPENMNMAVRIKRKDSISDIWVVRQNINIYDIYMQEEEVSDVKWVSKEELKQMIKDNEFYNYGEEYFNYIL